MNKTLMEDDYKIEALKYSGMLNEQLEMALKRVSKREVLEEVLRLVENRSDSEKEKIVKARLNTL